MKSVFFKMQTGFNYSPNKLIPVNSEYTFKGSDCSLGSFFQNKYIYWRKQLGQE